MPIDISLSVEEIAVALGAEGNEQAASSILLTQFGKLSKNEMEGRLYSAIHALMADGRLSSAGDGSVHNSPELKEVAEILSRVDYTVRYQRRDDKTESFLAYHFLGKKVFEHRPKQKVIHHIKEVTQNAVIIGGINFLNIQSISTFDFPVCSLPVDALKMLQPNEKTEIVLDYLEAHEFPSNLRMDLIRDITTPKFRASILRIGYDEKNAPYSQQGFLLLQGPKRNWIFAPEKKNGKDYLSVLPGSSKNFRKSVTGLIIAQKKKKG